MERGVPCIRLDDAFSTLRFLFVDDDDGEEGEKKDGAGAGAAGGGGEAASSSSSFLFFAASAEALAAAAAAIASKEAACCSRGGASAVAAQVLSWATSKEALLLAGAAAAGEAGVEGSSSAASAAAAAAFLTRLAAAWRLLAVAEGETLLEGGKLRAAVAEAAAGGGEPGAKRDLEVLVEGAGRAAAKLFESGPLSSSERAVSVACCELLAALAGLYRSSSAPSPSPRIGMTSTAAKLVWRAALALKGDWRTRRCVPFSPCRWPYAKAPSISISTDLMPASSPAGVGDGWWRRSPRRAGQFMAQGLRLRY